MISLQETSNIVENWPTAFFFPLPKDHLCFRAKVRWLEMLEMSSRKDTVCIISYYMRWFKNTAQTAVTPLLQYGLCPFVSDVQ